jgi:coupling of ubiquitin conjugation to ER degradation protein 1
MNTKPASPDLIQRYNLTTKVSQELAEDGLKEKQKSGWSNSKNERQTALQKRREAMILAARKKMTSETKDGSS